MSRLPVSAAARPRHDADYCKSIRLGLAWNRDGTQLAAISGEPCSDRWPGLRLIGRDGQVQRQLFVGSNGMTREPQWTPDGRFVMLNTFPRLGRRIVVVDVASAEVSDLTQPRWDAFATLAPDGGRLLLWNGRGGFWTADLERR